jgi:putative acetyltransferase
MDVRRALPSDREALLDIWLRSVRATHDFVPPDAVRSMIPEVREYLASAAELWVIAEGSGPILGFLGMQGSEIRSLFIAPDLHRRGAGRRLVRHARELRGELTVCVNEQNAGAVRFYEACGFVVEGRSPLDDQGSPYPLLQLRLAAPSRDLAIRPLEPADREWATDLVRRHFGSPLVVSRGVLHDTRTLPGLVADGDGAPAGLLQHRDSEREAEVVVLIAARRRAGVGTALLREMCRRAEARELRRVWLVTTNDNRAAQAFYEAAGFRRCAVHRDAVAVSRRLKPEIPEHDEAGVPIRDEIEYERVPPATAGPLPRE